MPTPTIDNLPPAPSPTDSRAEFSTKTFNFYAAMAGFIAQVNAGVDWIAAQLATIAGHASSTASASADAVAAAAAAAAAAGAAKWQPVTVYADGAVVWSPITYRTYRRRGAGSGGADPSVNVAAWELQSAGLPPAGQTVAYTGGRVTSVTEDGVTRTITYDAQGRVNTIAYPRGSKTRTETYTYNGAGKYTGMTAVEA